MKVVLRDHAIASVQCQKAAPAQRQSAHLLGEFIPLPDTSLEGSLPVARWVAYAINVASRAPNVPITLGIGFGRSRLLKPAVQVTCVVNDQVENTE